MLKRIIQLVQLSFFHARLFLKYRFLFLKRFTQNGFKTQTVLFYPQKPEHRNVVYKILCNLGCRMTSNPARAFDLAFNWEDTTLRKPDAVLLSLTEKKQIFNSGCKDISKNHIGELFEKIFGYSIKINPEKYSGRCIKKSNFNADRRRGKELLVCPVKAEEGYAYEKMINTQNSEGKLVDFRVVVFKNKIPFTYVRTKENTEIFSDGIKPTLKIESSENIFSKQEIKKISDFAKAMNLDCGEMDILRDNKDKKIYIVDVNTTPFGLHNVPENFRKEALEKLSVSFKEQFFN